MWLSLQHGGWRFRASFLLANPLRLSIESPLGSVEDDRPNTWSWRNSKTGKNSHIWISFWYYGTLGLCLGHMQIGTCKSERPLLPQQVAYFGLGGWIFKKKPQIVDFLMSNLSSAMTSLFSDGSRLVDGTGWNCHLRCFGGCDRGLGFFSEKSFLCNVPERMLAGGCSHSDKWDWTWCCRSCLILLMRKGFFDLEGSSQIYPTDLTEHTATSLCGAEPNERHHPFAVFPNPFGTWKISSVHPVAVQKHLTRCCLSSGPTGLYRWTSWIRLLMAMLKCNKFVVLPWDSTKHTAMGWGCHGTVVVFFTRAELHDVSSLLRSFGTEVQYDGGQGFHHETQVPCITPLMLSGASLVRNPTITSCDVNEDFLGRITRLSKRVGFRLVDLRDIQRYFLKINCLLRKRNEKAKGTQEWGSNGTSKSDAILRNDSQILQW